MRLTAASLVALALACFWLVGTFEGCDDQAREQTRVTEAAEPRVILISLDGFRADYLDRADVQAPTLRRLAREGVRAQSMTPVFPSVTLPNHWSLATGLHPQDHGIVANEFRAPDGRLFNGERKTGMTEPEWWGGEPIWATAERQGLRVGTVFWPGSQAIRPGRWLAYDAAMPYEARVDTALAWLDLPRSERPHFVTLYFEAVDSAGHRHGPDTPEVAAAIERVDDALARLVAGLEARGLLATTDLVVVSDHGMTSLSRDRLVYLDDAVDLDTEADEVLWSTPTHIWPAKGTDSDSLVARLDVLDYVRAYRREDTPEHLHYRANDRIGPIVVLPDEGWSVTTRARVAADPTFPIPGSHGFDPREATMQALFIARGPRFRVATETGTIQTVDVHGIVAGALDIQPAPTSGDPRSARRVLR
ncbi:MAG: ectonucleotide pyrophosphatase/phosphodiesterase [Bacteroidota bacterium]